jgi:acetyl-CoA synthetase
MIKITTPDINRHLHRHKGVRTYLHDQYRYEKYFIGEWYLSCDLTKKDADGYFCFVGRADDIIKTSGHMVGPFDVDSTFMRYLAAPEAEVIEKLGVPLTNW